MSHDRGCFCGREKYEYNHSGVDDCTNRQKGLKPGELHIYASGTGGKSAAQVVDQAIKECLDILSKQLYNTNMMMSNPPMNAAIWNSVTEIKNKFKVE